MVGTQRDRNTEKQEKEKGEGEEEGRKTLLNLKIIRMLASKWEPTQATCCILPIHPKRWGWVME